MRSEYRISIGVSPRSGLRCSLRSGLRGSLRNGMSISPRSGISPGIHAGVRAPLTLVSSPVDGASHRSKFPLAFH